MLSGLVETFVLTERLHRAEQSHGSSTPVPVTGRRGDHVLVITPGGRFDRRRAHALVCDSRRDNTKAELNGVVSAEPPVWTDGVALMPLSAMSPTPGIARPALVSGLSSLAARRSGIPHGGGPRSMHRLRSHAADTSTEYEAESFIAAGAGI